MVYITGDMHGEQRLNDVIDFSKRNKDITSLIILGDFGGIWKINDLTIINELSKLTIDILFIDGNHENFDLLNTYPIEDWNGGKVHKISHNIRHLIRGYVFNIEGNRYFAFGGAESKDKGKRWEHISWWEQEIASMEDIETAQHTLSQNKVVDYVITHVGQMEIVQEMSRISPRFQVDKQSVTVSQLLQNTKYYRWFFGHYHNDVDYITDDCKNYSCVYRRFIPIKEV